MALDVVVVNYKTPDLLIEFCGALVDTVMEEDFAKQCTLTIVDVEAPDNLDWLPNHIPGHPRYIPLKDNVGYGKACNIGAAFGEFDVILLANADTVIKSGLKECHDALLAHENWGILGPRQVDQNNCITAGGIPGTHQNHHQRGWGQFDSGQFSDVLENVYSVSGSLYFIRRSLWEELTNCPIWQEFTPGITGAFLETRHYFEETTCSRHAVAHGSMCVYYGPAKMTHYFHRSSPHGSWQDQEVERSKQMHRAFLQLHGIPSE